MPEVKAPWLARLLFPRHQPHLQRQQLRYLLWAIAVGLIIAGTAAGLMYWNATKPH